MESSIPLIALALLTCVISRPLFGEHLVVTALYLAADHPSPFSAQLQVRVTNDSFTSANLLGSMASSQLIVDGQPFKRVDIPFPGPAGLGPKGSWERCLSIENYVPGGLSPGTHHLQLEMGGASSQVLRVKAVSAAAVAETPEERTRQVQALQNLLTPGLLQSCVENWLPDQDGGLQGAHQIRYYVDPGVKVVVTYEDAQPEPRLKGRVRMYKESRIED